MDTKIKQRGSICNGRNGTVISESGYLKSKKSALKNIKAMAGVFGIESNVPVKVVNCTGERKEMVVL